MERKKYLEIGVILIAIGGAVATIPSWVNISYVLLSTVFQYVGVAIVIIGLLLCIIPFLPTINIDYPIYQQVKRNNLKAAYAFCKKVFSGDFSSFNSSKRWFNKNSDLFWIVEQSIQKGVSTLSEIQGFFSIIPLTHNGKDRLLNGDINGSSLIQDHISLISETPSAYYIGAVGAKGFRAKGVVIGAITAELRNALKKHNVDVYTTPTTKDGLRIAQKAGFEAIDGSGAKDLNKLYILEGSF